MNVIALRIQRSMEKNNLSFRDLEKRTGIPRVSIQRYANGTTGKIPMKRLMVIADALNTSISYLLGVSDNEPQDFTDIAFELALHENFENNSDRLIDANDKEIDLGLVALGIRKMFVDNFGKACSIEDAQKIADLLCDAVLEDNLIEFLRLYSEAKPALREAALSVLKAGAANK